MAVKFISDEKILEHVRKIKESNDEESFRILNVQFGPIIRKIANKYCNVNVEYEDLVQVLSIELLRCARDYKEDLNNKFTTYVFNILPNRAKRELRDNQPIVMSRNIKMLFSKLNRIDNKYAMNNEGKPSLKNYIKELEDENVDDIKQALKLRYIVRLDEVLPGENKGTEIMHRVDLLEDTNTLNTDSIIEKVQVDDIMSKLKDREKEILYDYYVNEMTTKEIANKYNYKQPHGSRLKNNATKKFKELYNQKYVNS